MVQFTPPEPVRLEEHNVLKLIELGNPLRDEIGEPQPTILICGLVRNCEKTIAKELDAFRRFFSGFEKIRFLLIESDSSDNTVVELRRLEAKNRDIEVLSLGFLAEQLANRVDRIAFCRNVYLKRVLETESVDFMIVADFDNLNTELGSSSFDFQLLKGDFSALFANQDGPYYDLYALRHDLWCPNNVFDERMALMEFGMSEREAGLVSVVAKMIRIPKNAHPIQVRSAFGGLGIYRVSDIPKEARYSSRDRKGNLVCEHVSLNEAITEAGGKLFVVPSLINARVTEHTRRVSGFRMIVRWAIWPIRSLVGLRRWTSVF